jgi:hypothetical protein
MTEPYIFWALITGLVAGGAIVWFALGRLPRRDDDVSDEERMAEAQWISSVVNRRGGLAPEALVEEILELHGQYLAGPPIDLKPDDRDALAARRRERAATTPRPRPGSAKPAPGDASPES